VCADGHSISPRSKHSESSIGVLWRSEVDNLLQVLEYNAGAGNITKAMLNQSVRAVGLDQAYSKHHDCLHPKGFKLWIEALLVITVDGHIWTA
jgi:hypothetical protein